VVGIRIGFVSRREMESVKLVESLINKFKSRAEISVEPELGERLGMKGAPVEEMDVDLVVSVGGDGTILRTIHKMRDPVPILGINMGTLGFLVDVEPRDAVKTLEHILFGFEVDERSRLEVALNGNALLPATNEVALLTASPAKMIDFEIIVDGSPLEALRADGMIFATATGSTAYAMSAGGPIVDPRVDAMVLVPMAPFKLSARPWVIPGDSIVSVRLIHPEKEALIAVDGQSTATISCQDSVVITKAKTPARFVRTARDGFYEKVKSKLT
jgi:NAD+ kinase